MVDTERVRSASAPAEGPLQVHKKQHSVVFPAETLPLLQKYPSAPLDTLMHQSRTDKQSLLFRRSACMLGLRCGHTHPTLSRSLYQHVRGLAQAQGVCGIRLYADDDNARAQATVRPQLPQASTRHVRHAVARHCAPCKVACV